MRPRRDLPVVYLCRRPVDFRKGMRALAVLVEQELGRAKDDPPLTPVPPAAAKGREQPVADEEMSSADILRRAP